MRNLSRLKRAMSHRRRHITHAAKAALGATLLFGAAVLPTTDHPPTAVEAFTVPLQATAGSLSGVTLTRSLGWRQRTLAVAAVATNGVVGIGSHMLAARGYLTPEQAAWLTRGVANYTCTAVLAAGLEGPQPPRSTIPPLR